VIQASCHLKLIISGNAFRAGDQPHASSERNTKFISGNYSIKIRAHRYKYLLHMRQEDSDSVERGAGAGAGVRSVAADPQAERAEIRLWTNRVINTYGPAEYGHGRGRACVTHAGHALV